jgi:hypothetical protein
MATCKEHAKHDHKHGPDCGHRAIQHEGHTDYLHDGHLHNLHGGHVDEHRLAIGDANPQACTPAHDCDEHDDDHEHGKGCGHEAVPHGDHTDYLVGSHLHHAHDGHCDDHGAVMLG